jgi:DNA-binding NarL/FixJ family response regulator
MVGQDVLERQSGVLDRRRPGANASAPSASMSHTAKGAVILIDSQRFRRERLALLLIAEMPHFEIVSIGAFEALAPNQIARANVIAINALPEAKVARTCAAMSSKPVLWLCEDIESDPSHYDDVHIFPARCSGALLAAALQLIAAGGRFLAPRIDRNHGAPHHAEGGPQDHAPSLAV